MTEQWIQWEPIKELAPKYYIQSVFDGVTGFRITLCSVENSTNKVKILFKHGVDSYIRTDESFRLKIIHDLDKKYGPDFYGKWTFFKVTHSNYLRWMYDQSYGLSEDRSFIHFSFIAEDSILDVISTREPKAV